MCLLHWRFCALAFDHDVQYCIERSDVHMCTCIQSYCVLESKFKTPTECRKECSVFIIFWFPLERKQKERFVKSSAANMFTVSLTCWDFAAQNITQQQEHTKQVKQTQGSVIIKCQTHLHRWSKRTWEKKRVIHPWGDCRLVYNLYLLTSSALWTMVRECGV